MKRVIEVIFFTILTASAAAKDLVNVDFVDELPTFGRQGLHGMVVFGSGPYFMSHIPMFMAPHDMQILMKVSLKDQSDQPLKADLSSKTFTLRPQQFFSLNRLAKGLLKKFKGNVHQGSFETGGPIAPGLSDVTVDVEEIMILRPLPSESEVDHLQVEDQLFKYLINVITTQPGQSSQEITNSTKNIQLWCVTAPDFFNPCP